MMASASIVRAAWSDCYDPITVFYQTAVFLHAKKLYRGINKFYDLKERIYVPQNHVNGGHVLLHLTSQKCFRY